MTLGFGLLSAQLRPGETDWTRAYDDTVRLAVEAERLAFTSVRATAHPPVDDGPTPPPPAPPPASARPSPGRRRGSRSAPASSSPLCTTRCASPRTQRPSSC